MKRYYIYTRKDENYCWSLLTVGTDKKSVVKYAKELKQSGKLVQIVLQQDVTEVLLSSNK